MNASVQTFTSSGKFLITAEYLILKGAKGLALPLKFGQELTVQENESGIIEWRSVANDTTWFEATFKSLDFEIVSSNDNGVADTLRNIFAEIRTLNYAFMLHGGNFEIAADFNLSWGLGSSSTLINNLALYAKVDPYLLFSKTEFPLMASPHILSRGKMALSISTDLIPLLAKCNAQVVPAGPAPTIAT